MRRASDLPRSSNGDSIQLDRAGRCHCRLDANGRPVEAIVNGKPGDFVPYSPELDLSGLADHVMVTGTQRTPMKAAVMVRQQTKRPLVLLGDRAELLGIVGEHELYRGMLGQIERTAPSQSDRFG